MNRNRWRRAINRARITAVLGAALLSVVAPPTAWASAPQNAPASARGSVTVPISVRGNYLYVDATINGKPARFVLDTGAGSNILTPDAAKRLGIDGEGKFLARGAGEQTVSISRAKLPELKLGDIVLANPETYILELPPAIECDGLIGFPLLARFVTTIDYAAQTLTLTPRESFVAPKDAASVPLRLRNNIPEIEGKIDGLPGWFSIDTGAGDALTLFPAFVDKHRLRLRYFPRIETVTGRGVGGVTYGDLVRADGFTLGEFTISKPIVDLSRQKSGAFASTEIAGNIGAETLSRFVVTLDYVGRRAFLKKGPQFERPPQANRSGVGLDFDGTRFLLAFLIPNSPATAAGIRPGDILLAIDGVPVERLGRDRINGTLHRAPGTKVVLTVQTGATSPRDVTLILRDLL